MEEARAVVARLDRIDRLERDGAPPAELLEEVRSLLREAEAWVRVDRAAGVAADALERCREALEYPPEMAQAAGRTLVA
jgi:hypothetical protein